MVQELKCRIAVVGGGPAGCFCAAQLQDKFAVTVFEVKSPLITLLPTGGGRCNLAHAEYDFRELAKNYPRGEKFLYSVFSRFSTADTIEFFEKIGVDTYIQDDMRIFPVSNSAKDVRQKFLASLKQTKFIKEYVLRVDRTECDFKVVTDAGCYHFDKVIIAAGGHRGYDIARLLGHNIIEPRPALVGLRTKEDFSSISGVSINDVLFTHKGISGPAVYKISSLKAREKFPYKIKFNFTGDIDLQAELNRNPHKSIKNLLSEFVPKSFAEFVLIRLQINPDEKSHRINGKTRDKILSAFQNFEITAVGTVPDGEVVTSGGVDLKEINPKTMESRIVPGIYFCGEVIDVDGFCGGFNLQNCWSTAYIASISIASLLP